MADNSKVDVVIRVMPKGDEIDATLPLKATGKQVVQKLLSDPSIKLPKADPQGQTITYKLMCKDTGKEVNKETLEQAEIKKGYILLLTPDVIAGQDSDSIQ